MADKPKVLELDSRKRISLGSLARHNYYLANVTSTGTIVLTPAAVIPAIGRDKATPVTETGEGEETVTP